ncbi:MAG TPA: adenylyl-sulfate kinase [Gammaproteobacteria bacterium]|nr:adenylyl-sulfate kinase [Gammaproteobacteria bacterium]
MNDRKSTSRNLREHAVPGESGNIVPHQARVTKQMHTALKRQKACILWFTGLSGSGKSTTANALELRLFQMGFHTHLLDGDNIRYGLNKDLDFSQQGRVENIRRVGEVSKLFVDAGLMVLTAFISPFRSDRLMVRELVERGEFIEIYLDTPLEVCESRDPKGLYKKARAGKIKDFTGIDSPYETPEQPELVLHSDRMTVDECVDAIIDYLRRHNIIN